MKTWLRMSIAIGMIGGLAACSEEKKDVPPPVRPVMWTTVVPQNNASIVFAGTIEPQLTANLGFQALGRIVSRDANIGDRVVTGQKLASLDPISAELALKIAESDLISAQAQETNALTAAQRQESLLERNAVAQADVDIARQARDSAIASVLQAQANVDKAREQLGYTELKATFDGVVTAVSAEVGQTVSPGAAVLTIAEPNRRDAVVDVPDGLDEAFKLGTPFVVAMQANPSILAKGTVREVAPDADPITRTRRIKIGLDSAPVNMRLGTTITATLAASSKAAIYVPKSAVFEKDGKSFVWVIDAGKAVVNAREVSLGGDGHGGIVVTSGLEAGMKVATAGVHTLEEGQAIKFDGGESQ
jgi:RND family efflux transporter MFP subunit